jgi:hypothetical protein
MEIRSGAREELRAVFAADMGKWGRLVKEPHRAVRQGSGAPMPKPAAGVAAEPLESIRRT